MHPQLRNHIVTVINGRLPTLIAGYVDSFGGAMTPQQLSKLVLSLKHYANPLGCYSLDDTVKLSEELAELRAYIQNPANLGQQMGWHENDKAEAKKLLQIKLNQIADQIIQKYKLDATALEESPNLKKQWQQLICQETHFSEEEARNWFYLKYVTLEARTERFDRFNQLSYAQKAYLGKKKLLKNTPYDSPSFIWYMENYEAELNLIELAVNDIHISANPNAPAANARWNEWFIGDGWFCFPPWLIFVEGEALLALFAVYLCIFVVLNLSYYAFLSGVYIKNKLESSFENLWRGHKILRSLSRVLVSALTLSACIFGGIQLNSLLISVSFLALSPWLIYSGTIALTALAALFSTALILFSTKHFIRFASWMIYGDTNPDKYRVVSQKREEWRICGNDLESIESIMQGVRHQKNYGDRARREGYGSRCNTSLGSIREMTNVNRIESGALQLMCVNHGDLLNIQQAREAQGGLDIPGGPPCN